MVDISTDIFRLRQSTSNITWSRVYKTDNIRLLGSGTVSKKTGVDIGGNLSTQSFVIGTDTANIKYDIFKGPVYAGIALATRDLYDPVGDTDVIRSVATDTVNIIIDTTTVTIGNITYDTSAFTGRTVHLYVSSIGSGKYIVAATESNTVTFKINTGGGLEISTDNSSSNVQPTTLFNTPSVVVNTVQSSEGVPQTVSNNIDATTNPTISDDENSGYTPASIWVNTTTDSAWVCVDATAGSAGWLEIGGGVNISNSNGGAQTNGTVLAPNSLVKTVLDGTGPDVKYVTETTNTAYNKNYGTTAGTASVDTHTHDLVDISGYENEVKLAVDAVSGVAGGIATIDWSGKIPSSQIAYDTFNYVGTWNAGTNSPSLPNGTDANGDYRIVDNTGSTTLNGILDWETGDWVIFDGTNYQKIDNSNLVDTVAGRTGDVVLTQSDVADLSNVQNTKVNLTATTRPNTDIDYSEGSTWIDTVRDEVWKRSATEWLRCGVDLPVGVPEFTSTDYKIGHLARYIDELYDINKNTVKEPVIKTYSNTMDNGRYRGAVYSPTEEKLYFIRSSINNASNWYYINSTGTTVEIKGVENGPSGTYDIYGGTYHPILNRIYLSHGSVIGNSDHWYYIDCNNGSFQQYAHGLGTTTDVARVFIGGEYCPTNGCIYFTSGVNKANWVYINAEGNVHTFPQSIAFIPSTGGGVYAPTQNRIYYAPKKNLVAANSLYIDCSNNNTGLITIDTAPASSTRYFGGVYSPSHDAVIFAPTDYKMTEWMYIDCATNTLNRYLYISPPTVDDLSTVPYIGATYVASMNRIYFNYGSQVAVSSVSGDSGIAHYIDCNDKSTHIKVVQYNVDNTGMLSNASNSIMYGGCMHHKLNRLYYIPHSQSLAGEPFLHYQQFAEPAKRISSVLLNSLYSGSI
jgi:hypothetical protein